MTESERETKKLKRQTIALVILALICLATIVALAIIFIAEPLPRVAMILTAMVGLWSMAFFGMKAGILLLITLWKEQDNEHRRSHNGFTRYYSEQ